MHRAVHLTLPPGSEPAPARACDHRGINPETDC